MACLLDYSLKRVVAIVYNFYVCARAVGPFSFPLCFINMVIDRPWEQILWFLSLDN
jgi:hypothetical protein